MCTIAMPKTYKERLTDLEIGNSILIDEGKRWVWANAITRLKGVCNKQFTLRKDTETGELRVWRLSDKQAK